MNTDSDPRSAILEDAFKALRNNDDRGRTWMDREAAFSHDHAGRYIAHVSAEIVINAAMKTVSSLKPGQALNGVEASYTLEQAQGLDDGVRVAISERGGPGEWSISLTTGFGGSNFTVRHRQPDETAPIVVSGGWSKASPTGKDAAMPYHVLNSNFSGDLRPLLKLVATVRPEVPKPKPRTPFLSEPVTPILEADGWIPGTNCRKLHRALYEDAARRVLEWAGPLFDETMRMYASEGLWWGKSALVWSYSVDGRFPDFNAHGSRSCLVPREGKQTTAAVFRDARPYLETITYLVWRDIAANGAPGTLNLLPIDNLASDDIEEFISAGGVPAIAYEPSSGAVRVTERAISSNVLETFARHVGEAWSVLRQMPLYSRPGDRRMFSPDFTVFDRVEPWTRLGKALSKQAVSETVPKTKSPRP